MRSSLIAAWYTCLLMASTLTYAQSWDKYKAFLWMYQGPERSEKLVEALKNLGVNGINVYNHEATSEFAVHSGLAFYVDNIAGKGDLYLNRNEWHQVWNSYIATRNKKNFIRPRCLNDPAVIQRIKSKIREAISLHKDKRPMAYALDDEISITSFTNPFDFCFSPYCLKKYRTWLIGVYRDLAALNKEWETQYKNWDDVTPITTDEIRSRELTKNPKHYNFSPWADHRTFMDSVLADTVRSLVEYTKTLDPKTPVGITGGQAPSAFGGYDWWKLMEVIDFVEPYDLGGSREIIRSFNTRHIPIVQTLGKSEGNPSENLWRLWYYLAHGDRGTIIWSSGDYFKDKDPGKPSEYALSLANTFKELSSSDFLRITAEGKFRHYGIAIYYSQPSIQAHWMLDSKADERTWPKRLTSHELANSSMIRDVNAWRKIIEDLGFQYNFISYQQVKKGELIKQNYKVLVMPKTICLSEKEAEEIVNFVGQGGFLIADYQTALMDEHCKSLSRGRLDPVFGVARSSYEVAEEYGNLRPVIRETFKSMPIAEPSLTVAAKANFSKVRNVPCMIYSKSGKGKTLYLNLGVMKYITTPSEAEKNEIRNLFKEVLENAGLRARVNVFHNGKELQDCERIIYESGGKEYLFLVSNKPSSKTNPVRIRLIFGYPVELKNLRTGKSFNKSKEIEDMYLLHEANIYEIKGL